jgi:hypothetical protein
MRGTLKLRNIKWGFHSVYICSDITTVDLVNLQNLIIEEAFTRQKLIEMFIEFLKPNFFF